jgi:hypothetical protein
MDSFIKLSVVLGLIILAFFKADEYYLKIGLKESLINNQSNLCLSYYQSLDSSSVPDSAHTSLVFIDNNKCTANFFTRKLSATQIFGGNCKSIRMSWDDYGAAKIICSLRSGKNNSPILRVEKYKNTDIKFQFVN